ncbi:MAG: hypothetical protein PHU23_06025 [Dehalococcoidales bacterium]|nr:hypothetical protein [Dehalococcoidales bacterium]
MNRILSEQEIEKLAPPHKRWTLTLSAYGSNVAQAQADLSYQAGAKNERERIFAILNVNPKIIMAEAQKWGAEHGY